MTYFDVRIPGLKMTVVEVDGQYVHPLTVDEIRIATAETFDVIVEPTGQDDQSRTLGPFTHARLGQGPTPCAHVQKRPSPPIHAVQRGCDDVRPHNLSRTATGRGVVEEAALILGKLANVHRFQSPQTVLAPSRADQRDAERAGIGLGKHGQDGGVEGHGRLLDHWALKFH